MFAIVEDQQHASPCKSLREVRNRLCSFGERRSNGRGDFRGDVCTIRKWSEIDEAGFGPRSRHDPI
jgi:hypothetical protein